MVISLGLYFSNVIGTKVLPNDPVPPVMRIDLFLSILKLLIQVKVIEFYTITSCKFLVYFAPVRYFYFENAISFLINISYLEETSQIGSPIKSAISSKSRDPSENASTWLTMASKLDSFLGPPTVFLKSYLVKCGSPFISQCGVTLSSKALRHNLANSKPPLTSRPEKSNSNYLQV